MAQTSNVDVLLFKYNETYLKVETEHKHILQEISDYFTIQVPGAKFMPAYKKGWDGKLRLFNQRTRRLYLGLFSELISFLKEFPYSFLADEALKTQVEVSDTHIQEYLKSLNLPYQLRDYQYNALAITLRNRRATIQSSTGSGKSLIIYTITRYFDDEKVLIIVPTISLTTQLYGDFRDYSKNDDWEVDDYVHVITAGVEKDSAKNIYISTWQSLYALPKEYFQQFRTIIADECFDGSTKIVTNKGPKKISQIEVGDTVLSYNENSKVFEDDEVTAVHKNLTKSSHESMMRIHFNNGVTVDVTSNHKFLTKNRGWVRADELDSEDDIVDSLSID